MVLRIFLCILLSVSFLPLFDSSPVSAITGTSASINMRADVGQMSYTGAGASVAVTGSSAGISGIYDDADILGRFGAGSFNNSIIVVSSINLSLPANDSGNINTSLDFRYIPTSNYDIKDCSLYIDGYLKNTSDSVNRGVSNVLSASNITTGRHQWDIACHDHLDASVFSPTWDLVVIKAMKFDENSTDLTQVDLNNITNLTLSKSDAKIVFNDAVDLSHGADLDSNIVMTPLSITINSEAMPELNKSATLSLYNVPFNHILIWHDGVICTTCQIISSDNGQLIFNVTGFSNYTVTSTSRLSVADTTDSLARYVKQRVVFTANYSNILSGAPLSGSCMISFHNETWSIPVPMAYNSSSGLYTYSRSFNTTGIQGASVSCNTTVSGFDNLTASDDFFISAATVGSMANTNATVISSSRMNVSSGAANISSEAGNVTELVVNSTTLTRAWQGYYGNVTGSVSLRDANNNLFYDWNMSSVHGEIYATRASVVDWFSVRCANIDELYAEDAYLGMNSTIDGESITRTFFNTTSFRQFYMGNVLINDTRDCYSTNLYTDTGAQNEAFSEIVMTDTSDIIYTGLIDNQITGFDTRQHDFEMIVGENGRIDNTPTTYYFYIEIG